MQSSPSHRSVEPWSATAVSCSGCVVGGGVLDGGGGLVPTVGAGVGDGVHGLERTEHLVSPGRPGAGPDVIERTLIAELAAAVDLDPARVQQGHGVVAADTKLERALGVFAERSGGAGNNGSAGRKGEGLAVVGALGVVEDEAGEADVGASGVAEGHPVLALASVGRTLVGDRGELERLCGCRSLQ